MSVKTAMGRIIWSPAGLELSAQECDWLAHSASAGLILFAENYANPTQLQELIAQARGIAPATIISVDQEGGRVQRLQAGFTRLPAVGQLGKLYAQEPEVAIIMAEQLGRVTAMELRACGINMNNAPVLDVDRGISRMIGDRAWASASQAIISLAAAYTQGLTTGGVLAVGKHFPGHGGVMVDSHSALPSDTRSIASVQEDMQPFKELADQLPCLMTAHIVYEQLDKQAATFSSFWLQEQLRTAMSYTGLIMSDDLCMGAVTALYAEIGAAVEAALEAGCDLLLICRDPRRISAAFECVERKNIPPLSAAQNARLIPPTAVEDDFDLARARAEIVALTEG